MEVKTDATQKGRYEKPVLEVLGTIDELTGNINVVGGGDTVFSVLNPPS